ncbi:MAG: hypothetical protein A2138_18995 [Deltaproteobacteria bacterium RBG_16_71_12]|nr:MAG: hypothetical protein A2138_18995 [Deltaproteobacteria bacterium RBG_16_71_12]
MTLFCEDRGHELLVRRLVERLARERSMALSLDTKSARGGAARALTELEGWQQGLRTGRLSGTPDLLVVVIDGNCMGHPAKQREIRALVDNAVFPRLVIGCPDPHVERWLIADASAFHRVVGVGCPRDPDKCERDRYKQLVGEAVAGSAVVLLTGVMELAPDLVDAMDLYVAGSCQPSLRAFVDDLNAGLTQLATKVAADTA